MKRMIYMNKLFAVGALAGTLLISGCSNEPASGPLSPLKSFEQRKTSLAKPGDNTTTSSIKPLTRKTRSTNGYGGTASKMMTASSGGSLGYMGHTIEVPKNAFFEQQKEFYITDVSSDMIQANYGPDGWFLLPVKVAISYADADISNADLKKLTIAWYSETLGMWLEVGGTVDRTTQTISVYVWHFTQYTLAVK